MRDPGLAAMEHYMKGYAQCDAHFKTERLRERIATAALQGLLAGPPDPFALTPVRAAAAAVVHADALIAALDGATP